MDEEDKKKIKATDKQSLHFKIKKQKDGCNFCWNGVRPFIGNMDMFGNDHLGRSLKEILDMLKENQFLEPGILLLGICTCGCEGCDDFYINISITDDTVIWDCPRADRRYLFDKTEYELAIQKLQKMITDYMVKEFKKEVYNYLTQKLKTSTKVAKSLMKDYDKGFEEYLEDNWSVSAVATAMMYGF